MKKWITIFLIFLIPMMAYFFLSKDVKADINMQPAFASQKPIVYKFASTMCHDCQEMSKIMQNLQPKYNDKIHFVDVKVDNMNKDTKKLIEKYGVTLVPTTVFLNSSGEEKYKVEGLVSQDLLEEYLKEIN